MHLGSTVTTIGFWVGTLLPVVYLPLFVAGIGSVTRFSIFLCVLVINIIALVIGHDYPGSRSYDERQIDGSRSR
ncbi:hypothetical protein [Natrialba asiatica]|uniref:Uncharacterized protein n=1 Tax=Natrialba asiatica (strain ATCC 700177 / DSM 12278 / JCM 9576 / FERM P-10747 / NBRC 102637 / 172P1) TaxID=29540 RepID=M0AMW3_NATA1|nr:hypothetical protein [Natrialba asiatica]ELY99267.1 hypothetical protein C481_15490 [Natrialba asiatica DSM 12278]